MIKLQNKTRYAEIWRLWILRREASMFDKLNTRKSPDYTAPFLH